MTVQTKDAQSFVVAEQLLSLQQNGRQLELLDGNMVELPSSGVEHSHIGARIVSGLVNHTEQSRSGICTQANGGYILSRNPDTVRTPDAAFISRHRLPENKAPKGFFDGAPDLAVEIISPSNTPSDIDSKVHDYLRAGTRLVWVVYSELRAVKIFRSNGTAELVEEGNLSGEDVLPGFELPLSEIFR